MSRYPKGYKKGDDVMPESKPVNPALALPDALRTMYRDTTPVPSTLHPDFVVIKDANGRWVPVSLKAFAEAAKNTCVLLDMPFDAILAMRAAYLECGGKMPMTAESVREVMG